MRRFFSDHGLTIVLTALFLGSLVGHALTGWHVENQELVRHHAATLGFLDYLGDPAFLSSLFENWESEFLQMSAYVVLTAFLVQRGSSESRDPDEPPRDADLAVQARKPGASPLLRRPGAVRWLYAHSLGIVLFSLFLASFVFHWLESARAAAQEAVQHGERVKGVWEYLGDAQLWFESFQNWQSEFFSTAVLVVLSIFLRQKESPESKPVAAPNSATGN